MDWALLGLGVAGFLAVTWQIARLESMQPTDGLVISTSYDGVVRNGISTRQVSLRAMGPAILYELRVIPLGATPYQAPEPTIAAFSVDSEPVTLDVFHLSGERPALILEWWAFTRLRGRPELQARRFDLIDERLLRWRWSRLPWRRGHGKWVHQIPSGNYELPREAIEPA